MKILKIFKNQRKCKEIIEKVRKTPKKSEIRPLRTEDSRNLKRIFENKWIFNKCNTDFLFGIPPFPRKILELSWRFSNFSNISLEFNGKIRKSSEKNGNLQEYFWESVDFHQVQRPFFIWKTPISRKIMKWSGKFLNFKNNIKS